MAEKKYRTGWFALRAMHFGVMQNADRHGRFKWDESYLYTQIARGCDMRRSKFLRMLHILSQLGDRRGKVWLCRYNEQGEFDSAGCYGHVRTFRKWQDVSQYEGERVGVKCPCGEVGNRSESANDENQVDTENNAFSKTRTSLQATYYIEGNVYMKAPLPGMPEIEAVLHDGMWHRVVDRPEFVTDWSGLESK
jgi:hypothetical protein